MNDAFRVAGVASICGAAVAILFGLYFFFQMWLHVRPEKRMLAPFLGPVMLFMPGLFDDTGNRARFRFAASLILFIIFFAVAALSTEALHG